MNAARPLLGLVVMLHSGSLWQAPDLRCDKAAAVARSQNLTPNFHFKKTKKTLFLICMTAASRKQMSHCYEFASPLPQIPQIMLFYLILFNLVTPWDSSAYVAKRLICFPSFVVFFFVGCVVFSSNLLVVSLLSLHETLWSVKTHGSSWSQSSGRVQAAQR